jgi:hypothetical protein
MAKHHGGTDHIQGVLHRGPPPQRIYANHGGTSRPQGVTRGPPQPRQYGLHGGTALPMGVLSGKKRK